VHRSAIDQYVGHFQYCPYCKRKMARNANGFTLHRRCVGCGHCWHCILAGFADLPVEHCEEIA